MYNNDKFDHISISKKVGKVVENLSKGSNLVQVYPHGKHLVSSRKQIKIHKICFVLFCFALLFLCKKADCKR